MKKKMLAILLALAVTLAGSYTVLAKNTTASKQSPKTAGITVNVDGVSLDQDSLTLAVGQSETLVANIDPSNATNQDVNWSSSDETAATVSSSGKVTGLKAGEEATITVKTVDGKYTDTCKVNVEEAVDVTGVSLDQKTLTLTVGKSETLVATITPDNATNNAVQWSSNDSDVATVNASGKVTAKAAGTATIKVKTDDGGYTAECAVTIEPGATDTGANISDTDSNNCPAAPAIANQLLKKSNVKSNDGKGENHGKYISQIAKQTGPNGELNKNNFENREAYEAAIKAYLIKIGAPLED